MLSETVVENAIRACRFQKDTKTNQLTPKMYFLIQ
jgi:hypothetical protein